jgi:hypothetical protein
MSRKNLSNCIEYIVDTLLCSEINNKSDNVNKIRTIKARTVTIFYDLSVYLPRICTDFVVLHLLAVSGGELLIGDRLDGLRQGGFEGSLGHCQDLLLFRKEQEVCFY